MPTGTCFVVMGFGKKTDFGTGRTLDLDKSYRNVIKPGVAATGMTCVRADEIVHSGLIDTPMYDQLLKAVVVVADKFTFILTPALVVPEGTLGGSVHGYAFGDLALASTGNFSEK